VAKKEKNDKSNHYIDNSEFFIAMSGWKKLVLEAEASGEPNPPVTEYIGECFWKIAEHLSYRPNFINYPYREEMIGDGIENCLMYCHNFDPEKSKNPFSYFTQIIYYAFLRRIQKEKKQNYIKYKLAEASDVNGNIPRWYSETFAEKEVKNPYADMFGLSDTDLKKFEPKKKKKSKNTSLEDIESEDSDTE
jgi:hypothetical protein